MKLKNSTYKIIPKNYPARVQVPTSKSYANRLLILGAISKEPVWINNLTPSTDVVTMIDALKAIGLQIKGDAYSGKVCIENSFPECEGEHTKTISLATGDGGTTNRFLLALLALGRNRYRLKTTGRMKERPSSEFFSVLKELGVELNEPADVWCEIQGPCLFERTELEVDCSRSTQFATALALVLGPRGIRILPKGLKNSQAYFDLTLELLARYQKGERSFTVPVDASSLTYPLALGFDGGTIRIPNCHFLDPFQADTQFIAMLEKTGASIKVDETGLILKRESNQNRPLDVSIASCPDLTPTLAFVCSLLKGRSHIRDIEILRHKESDRAVEIMKVLRAVGVEHALDEQTDTIWIEGPWQRPKEAIHLNLPDDHRIIMMAYLFLNAAAGGTVDNATHVEKSFPSFFQVMSGH